MLKKMEDERINRLPILPDVLRSVRVCVPAPSWEDENILVLEVASTLRPRLNHRPVAIC